MTIFMCGPYKENSIMDESIKGICIFAYGRSGSTLLCEQLAHAIKTKHGIDARPLYEILTPHCVHTPDHKELVVDNTGILSRPLPTQLGFDRLERLEETIKDGVFPVFKIFSSDLTPENRYLTERIIMKNPSIYKICLNRADVTNQFLSWMISCSTGVWHHYADTLKDELVNVNNKYTPSHAYSKSIAAGILLHYMWHFEVGYRTCQQTVWYDKLFEIDYPELGLVAADIIETQTKMNVNHLDAARKCLGNYDEMIDLTNRLEQSVRPMLERLRPGYFK